MAIGLIIFYWPRIAPVTMIGDMPPICSQIYFQLQPRTCDPLIKNQRVFALNRSSECVLVLEIAL
jgi:hypothetical protein